MINEKTGVDERCHSCNFYKPNYETSLIGECTKHWRLHQKTNTKTHYDLWCEHWKEKPNLQTQAQEQANMRNDMEMETEGPEQAVDATSSKLGVPSEEARSALYAIIRELQTQIKELSHMDSEATKSLVAASKAGDRVSVTEIGGMLRVIEMFRVNISSRISELKATLGQ